MSAPLFVQAQKEHPDLPDNYGLTITYLTGKSETFELASQAPITNGIFEFTTLDDTYHWIPITSIAHFHFDKRFTKVIELKNKK